MAVCTLVEGILTKFHNLDFEDLNESGTVQSWDSYEGGKLLSKVTRAKGGNREEVVYNADGTAVLEEYLKNGSVRVTKYDKDGNVTEVTINGQLIEEENNNLWIIIVIVAVAVIGAAALVIVLVNIKKRNAK